jgi:hypothetical protein
MKDTDLLAWLQGKLRYYAGRYQGAFSRPEWKFLYQMWFGILQSGEVQLSQIARALGEGISLKKTTERFARHMGREGLAQRVLAALLGVQRRRLRQCAYMVLDLSDLQKVYARKMEGLAPVYDGSGGRPSTKGQGHGRGKAQIGLGYWLCNVVGVSRGGEQIVPAYSELYSLHQESTSENRKILDAIRLVTSAIGFGSVWVMDRGCDRKELMLPLLRQGVWFVVRQVGNRSLWYRGRFRTLRWIGQKVNLRYSFTVEKKRKNRVVRRTYQVGAVRVGLTEHGTPLWLVVSKAEGRGYSWYLAHLPTEDERQAVKMAFEGYGCRWTIEEVHRHVKSEYGWERICLRRYVALKNMNAVFWAAISFVYTQLESVPVETFSKLSLLYKNKLAEVMGFIYYKLSAVLKMAFSRCTLRLKALYKWPDRRQLALQFHET